MKFASRYKAIRLIALLFIICFPVVGYTSSGLEPVRQSLGFKTFNSPGVSSIGNANAITQDSQGFMWFGGLSGLARFDGYTTKVFRNDPKNPQSLSGSYISDLLVDTQDRLWVATREGLNLYDPATETFVRYQHDSNDPASLSHNAVTSLAEGEGGMLWIATFGGGLNLFDPKTGVFVRYQYSANNADSLTNNNLRVVYVDHQGIVWIGTANAGLDRLDPNNNRFSHFSHNPNNVESLGSNTVRNLHEDSQHRLWVGTYGGGLNQFDRETGSFIRYSYDTQNNHGPGLAYIQNISEFDDGRLWVASDGGGLNLFDPSTGNFERYKHRPDDPTSLLGDKVQAIFKDRSGDWWFTHFPSGVSKTDPHVSAFNNYRYDPQNNNSLSNSAVLSVAQDRLGNIWVGTENGLNRLDRNSGEITRFHHDPERPGSLPAAAVLDVSVIADDQLWVGTWGGGARRFDPKTQSFTAVDLNLGDAWGDDLGIVWVVFEDSQQNIWLGSEGGGLVRYNPNTGQSTRFVPDSNDPSSISSTMVMALHEDSLGNFWVGTPGGLHLMNRTEGSFTRFTHSKEDPTSLGGNDVWSIIEDSKGNLWVGTRGGLNKLNRKTGRFTVYRAQEGLPNDTVKGILEDEQGYLWLSTENGLSRFNSSTEKFRHYSTEHGLPGNLFNRPAYLKTSKGELIFGSTNGLTIFDPEHLFMDDSAQSVVFTDFQLFNRSVQIGEENSPLQKAITQTDKIILTPEQSAFSLSFALLNYRAPELSQYAYKLEGFDANWNEVGAQRSATYTNLDAGSYVFRVKASNGDGIWNEEQAGLHIIVLPPWYESNLFRGGMLILILGVFHLTYLYRTRLIRRSEQILAYQVKERTRELEEKNQEIEHLANHDPLTGLPSLRLANQRLKIALNMAKRKEHIAAVLFLDLDGFKKINDTYGHESGDALLVEAALRVQKVIRDYDTACRIGGDEFLVILSEVEDVAFIEEICVRILSQINEPFTLHGENLKIEASIGCAYYPRHGDTEEELKKTADRLMYEVKNKGKNNYMVGN